MVVPTGLTRNAQQGGHVLDDWDLMMKMVLNMKMVMTAIPPNTHALFKSIRKPIEPAKLLQAAKTRSRKYIKPENR